MLDLPVGESMFILLSTMKGTDVTGLAVSPGAWGEIDRTWSQYQVCPSCDSNLTRAESKLLYSVMDGNLHRGVRTSKDQYRGARLHASDELHAVSIVILGPCQSKKYETRFDRILAAVPVAA